MNLTLRPIGKQAWHGPLRVMLFAGETDTGIKVTAGVVSIAAIGSPLRVRFCGLVQSFHPPFQVSPTKVALSSDETEYSIWEGQSSCGKRVLIAIGFFNATPADRQAFEREIRGVDHSHAALVKGTWCYAAGRSLAHELYPNAGRG